MFERCDVEIRFGRQGQPHPVAIILSGKRLEVAAYGRHWPTSDGLHLLVVTTDQQRIELNYDGCVWRARVANRPFAL